MELVIVIPGTGTTAPIAAVLSECHLTHLRSP